MIPIAQLLDKTLKKLPNAKRIKGQMVIDAWPGAVGEHIAQKAKAVSFENGTLSVWVRDSVWAQHLSLQKKQIISKLNRDVKTRVLTDIRFQVGGKMPAVECTETTATEENWRRTQTLDEETIRRIEAAFESTQLPPDLEKKMKNFFTAQQKRVQWYRQQGYPSCSVCGMPVVTACWEETCLCCKNRDNG